MSLFTAEAQMGIQHTGHPGGQNPKGFHLTPRFPWGTVGTTTIQVLAVQGVQQGLSTSPHETPLQG